MTTEIGTTALVGVDVGGSGIKAALVDLANGQATGRIRVATPQPATPAAIASTVAGLVHQFTNGGPIGCTLPAVVTNGVVHTATNIDKAWIGADATTLLSRATGRSCTVLNDADAAGMAEARFGSARARPGRVVMVTIGTGVGTAVLNDGVLVPNAELGHIYVGRHFADEWLSDATRIALNLSWKRWSLRLDRYLAQLHRDRRRHRQARRPVPRSHQSSLYRARRRARQSCGHRRRRARGERPRLERARHRQELTCSSE
jgi:polyphosphate glucokinase